MTSLCVDLTAELGNQKEDFPLLLGKTYLLNLSLASEECALFRQMYEASQSRRNLLKALDELNFQYLSQHKELTPGHTLFHKALPPVCATSCFPPTSSKMDICTFLDLPSAHSERFSLHALSACPQCGKQLVATNVHNLANTLLSSEHERSIFIEAPISHTHQLRDTQEREALKKDMWHFGRLRKNDALVDVEDVEIDKEIELVLLGKSNRLSIVIDHLRVNESKANRIRESIEEATRISGGKVEFVDDQDLERIRYGDLAGMHCPHCSFVQPSAQKTNTPLEGLNELSIGSLLAQLLSSPPAATSMNSELLERTAGLLNTFSVGSLRANAPLSVLTPAQQTRLRIVKSLIGDTSGALHLLLFPLFAIHPLEQKEILEGIVRSVPDNSSLVVIDPSATKSAPSVEIIQNLTNRGASEPTRSTVRTTRHSQRKELEWYSVHRSQSGSIRFPLEGYTVLCGGTESRYSEFLYNLLVPLAEHKINGKDSVSIGADWELHLPSATKDFVFLRASQNRSRFSTVLSELNLSKELCSFFASLPWAKTLGLEPGDFRMGSGSRGTCELCKGSGWEEKSLSPWIPQRVPCSHCEGLGFSSTILQIVHRSRNFRQVLNFTLAEAGKHLGFLKGWRERIDACSRFKLDDLRLSWPLSTLAHHEQLALKIVRNLSKKKPTLFFIDRPGSSMSSSEASSFALALRQLSQDGHSFLICDTHPTLLEHADYIIEVPNEVDFRNVGSFLSGTVDEMAKIPASLFGKYLRCLSNES